MMARRADGAKGVIGLKRGHRVHGAQASASGAQGGIEAPWRKPCVGVRLGEALAGDEAFDFADMPDIMGQQEMLARCRRGLFAQEA